MKECALCRQAARMYCESDRASLCFECDAKVHGANFLVARHTRCLLCRACQEPTPWKASGSRLGPTVSVCDKCVGGGCSRERAGTDEVERVDHSKVEDEEEGQEMGVETDSEDEDDYVDDDEDDEEDDDGGNQVVPLSIAGEVPPPPPPPAASSSSSSEDSSLGCGGGYSTKRKRGDVDLGESQGGQGCSSPLPYSRYLAAETEATSRWSTFARDDHLLGGGKSIRRSHYCISENRSPTSI